MNYFILIISIKAFFFNSVDASLFKNVVEYPVKKGIYTFNFEINHGLSMSIYNKERNTYDPIIFENNKYYVRNYSYTDSCPSRTVLADASLIDSVITLSGIHREMLLINRMFPGPPIVVPRNAKVEVTVTNKLLSEAVSIHWHGQTQKNNFYMDGVSKLTQCPISPGESFTYKFTASETGTHW